MARRDLHRVLQSLLVGVMLSAPATIARAQTPAIGEVAAVYDFYLGGIRAGDLTFSADFGAEGYDATSVLKTTGIVAFFYNLAFKARVEGRIKADGLAPAQYKAKSRSPKRTETIEISFENGSPATSRVKPPRKVKSYSIDARDQNGAIDPLSALLTAFIPAPVSEICEQRVDIYDGRRRFALEIEPPKRNSSRISCAGNYVRVAGFKAKWLGENAKRPFKLYLEERDDGMFEVVRAVIDSQYGPAILRLRK